MKLGKLYYDIKTNMIVNHGILNYDQDDFMALDGKVEMKEHIDQLGEKTNQILDELRTSQFD